MLSHPEIQERLDQFICVKIDPRDRNADQNAYRHKSTRYVPEVVFLDVRNGETVLGRLESRSTHGVVKELDTMLHTVR